MKRALKIIIPLLIVLALLITTGWYFFYLRSDLACGFLVHRAESMASHERYGRAERYYNWALSLDSSREDIPVALAKTYVADNNFTKAEYTLVKAIAASPDKTDLYVALSQTYVMQDKLLDAVQMLDRITDPNVKAQLDEMRPSAPTLSPESGYYTDYIEVTAEADVPYIYLTTDGNYPSTDADLYTEPVAMGGGETAVLAIAVDEQGLVSPVVRNGYTIGGVVEEVELQDPAIDAAVRDQLGLTIDDKIMSDQLWNIISLTLPETVADLSDLSYFTGLQSLTINQVSGLDFTVLTQLPALMELNLSGCTISSNSLEAIGSLVGLESLTMDSCSLTDISNFSRLTQLKTIHLANNTLKDISVLSLMTELEDVDISNNPVNSIAALSTCVNLKSVHVSSCNIETIGALKDKNDLEVLIASNNRIKDLADLEGCRNLMTLEVNNNQITDISVLTKLPNLTRFEADQNKIKAIPDFDEEACALVFFGADYNEIEDVSGLAGIHSLNYVNLDYNKITDLKPLAENYSLVQINVWDSAISDEDISLFKDKSIIVNYNPNYEAPEEEKAE